MFCVVIVLNPDNSAATVYLPVGSDGAVYSPLVSATTTRVSPVLTFFNVTVVPGITAPELSVMVPRMVPVTACAASDAGSKPATSRRPSATLFTFSLHAPAERRGTVQQTPIRTPPPIRSKLPVRSRPARSPFPCLPGDEACDRPVRR